MRSPKHNREDRVTRVMKALSNNDPMSLVDISRDTKILIGSLTTILKKLENDGLIESYWENEEDHHRLYKITAPGLVKHLEERE